MALLEVKHISKRVDGNIIIDDISFEQQALQKIAIAGESGAGKTTLLKMITGHIQPTGGSILFDGERVAGPEEKLMPGHKRMGYLSQHYELLNHYRVEELIWFENHLDEAEAKQLFKICRVDHLLHRKTNYLSGGEKQRIALCMLLVKQPGLLVLDEPFSNLDPVHTSTLKDVLDDITGRLKITCMLTSHDPHDTLSWADMILVIKQGKLLQQGSPQELYHRPVNEYVAGMFGKYNLLKPATAALFGIDTRGNTVMTRPENFRIYKTGSGVKGIINKVSFWGSFYEMEVWIDDTKLTVRSDSGEWRNGDKVFVGIS
ncbi:ABC transporter ATP-binding protein [Parafilimonas sp.]|uniref:ABC transporter ATP-binding protein n=1 Tax=Parafilimonas sp. TaxID=1969739 RepID=UPI0039E3CA6D